MNKINVGSEQITPSKVICIGRNYVEHITELGNEVPDDLVVFLKPNSAITNSLNCRHDEPLHFEGEICFVFYEGTFRYVGFGLDLTKRQLQSSLKSKGLPWERAKAFDGSALFSDFVPFGSNRDALTMELSIDGRLAQRGGVDLMIHKPHQILEQLQQFLTLENGDIVMTGTPKGVGEIKGLTTFKGDIYQDNIKLVSASWQAR